MPWVFDLPQRLSGSGPVSALASCCFKGALTRQWPTFLPAENHLNDRALHERVDISPQAGGKPSEHRMRRDTDEDR